MKVKKLLIAAALLLGATVSAQAVNVYFYNGTKALTKTADASAISFSPTEATIFATDGTKATVSDWAFFTFVERDYTGVQDVTTAKSVAAVSYVNLAGQQSAEPFEGVNLVVTTYTDGTRSVAKKLVK